MKENEKQRIHGGKTVKNTHKGKRRKGRPAIEQEGVPAFEVSIAHV